jgi:hypothetical protein
VSVPVQTVYRKELSGILTRWFGMVTEIPKYDNVKTRLLRTAVVVGAEQIPEDSSKIVFSEGVLRLSNNSIFLLIDHRDDSEKIVLVFGWKDCEYILRITTIFFF